MTFLAEDTQARLGGRVPAGRASSTVRPAEHVHRPGEHRAAARRPRRSGRSTARPTARCTSTSASSTSCEPVRRAAATSPRPTCIAHEIGHHVQNLLGISDEVAPGEQAPARRTRPTSGRCAWSCRPTASPACGRHVACTTAEAIARARRHRGGAGRGRGGGRRPHPGAGRHGGQPRDLDPRLGRAAPGVVRPRLRVRRAPSLRHVRLRGSADRRSRGPSGPLRRQQERETQATVVVTT